MIKRSRLVPVVYFYWLDIAVYPQVNVHCSGGTVRWSLSPVGIALWQLGLQLWRLPETTDEKDQVRLLISKVKPWSFSQLDKKCIWHSTLLIWANPGAFWSTRNNSNHQYICNFVSAVVRWNWGTQMRGNPFCHRDFVIFFFWAGVSE